VDRNKRQLADLADLNALLGTLSWSSAVNEHVIKCGICLTDKKICAADRNNKGRVLYFKQKHFDNCAEKNTGLAQSAAKQRKEMTAMRGVMSAFLQKPTPPVQSSNDISFDDIDADLLDQTTSTNVDDDVQL
jgi:hypothetical protein